MTDRLPADLEVRALVRAAEAAGDIGMIIHKGDADRGEILLIILQRGAEQAILAREFQPDGTRPWRRIGPEDCAEAGAVSTYIAKRRAIDPDMWVVELDLTDPARYMAQILEIS